MTSEQSGILKKQKKTDIRRKNGDNQVKQNFA